MRGFYLAYRHILQIPSGELAPSGKVQTASGLFARRDDDGGAARFRLPWSHYVRLLGVRNPEARAFYGTEALRGGWTIKQLDRQIGSQFYERTALSRNKAAMLSRGAIQSDVDVVTAEEEIKDPYLLEFLSLKDEYSESELEAALIGKLEAFLLELGGDFTFVGRQRRLRREQGLLVFDLGWSVSSHWPTADQQPGATPAQIEFARRWRDMPKVVFSSTTSTVDWNARLVTGDAAILAIYFTLTTTLPFARPVST